MITQPRIDFQKFLNLEIFAMSSFSRSTNISRLYSIWIIDFKRFTLDLEKAEKRGTEKPNLFDYMNVRKYYPLDDSRQESLNEIFKKWEGKYLLQ